MTVVFRSAKHPDALRWLALRVRSPELYAQLALGIVVVASLEARPGGISLEGVLPAAAVQAGLALLLAAGAARGACAGLVALWLRPWDPARSLLGHASAIHWWTLSVARAEVQPGELLGAALVALACAGIAGLAALQRDAQAAQECGGPSRDLLAASSAGVAAALALLAGILVAVWAVGR